MYYLSDVIDDLAFVFPYIRIMQDRYMDYNLSIEHRILVTEQGIKIAITPYDANHTRTEQD